MTRIEYDLVREQEPHLRLPPFGLLNDGSRRDLLRHTRETLIVMRSQVVLASESVDRDGFCSLPMGYAAAVRAGC
jgi:hypothetical protein